MTKTLTIVERRFVELWKGGTKAADIATELNLANSSVHDWRVRLGLDARHPSPRKYSEQDMATLRKLWCEQGLSASEIARQLGPDWNRNIVIGQVTRRGWAKAGRQKPSMPAAANENVRAPKAPPVKSTPHVGAGHNFSKGKTLKARMEDSAKKAAPIDPTKHKSDSTPEIRAEKSAEGQAIIAKVEASSIQSPNARPFLEATRGCKWPIGSGMAMLFCCNPVVGGVGAAKVYCAGHHSVAVSSVQPYRPRSPVSSFTRHDRVRTAKPIQAANDPFGAGWDQVGEAA